MRSDRSIDSKDVEELGLESGANVYYVDKLSNKVFTKPLTAMKGTDASNIHDEEVPACPSVSPPGRRVHVRAALLCEKRIRHG